MYYEEIKGMGYSPDPCDHYQPPLQYLYQTHQQVQPPLHGPCQYPYNFVQHQHHHEAQVRSHVNSRGQPYYSPTQDSDHLGQFPYHIDQQGPRKAHVTSPPQQFGSIVPQQYLPQQQYQVPSLYSGLQEHSTEQHGKSSSMSANPIQPIPSDPTRQSEKQFELPTFHVSHDPSADDPLENSESLKTPCSDLMGAEAVPPCAPTSQDRALRPSLDAETASREFHEEEQKQVASIGEASPSVFEGSSEPCANDYVRGYHRAGDVQRQRQGPSDIPARYHHAEISLVPCDREAMLAYVHPMAKEHDQVDIGGSDEGQLLGKKRPRPKRRPPVFNNIYDLAQWCMRYNSYDERAMGMGLTAPQAKDESLSLGVLWARDSYVFEDWMRSRQHERLHEHMQPTHKRLALNGTIQGALTSEHTVWGLSKFIQQLDSEQDGLPLATLGKRAAWQEILASSYLNEAEEVCEILAMRAAHQAVAMGRDSHNGDASALEESLRVSVENDQWSIWREYPLLFMPPVDDAKKERKYQVRMRSNPVLDPDLYLLTAFKLGYRIPRLDNDSTPDRTPTSVYMQINALYESHQSLKRVRQLRENRHQFASSDQSNGTDDRGSEGVDEGLLSLFLAYVSGASLLRKTLKNDFNAMIAHEARYSHVGLALGAVAPRHLRNAILRGLELVKRRDQAAQKEHTTGLAPVSVSDRLQEAITTLDKLLAVTALNEIDDSESNSRHSRGFRISRELPLRYHFVDPDEPVTHSSRGDGSKASGSSVVKKARETLSELRSKLQRFVERSMGLIFDYRAKDGSPSATRLQEHAMALEAAEAINSMQRAVLQSGADDTPSDIKIDDCPAGYVEWSLVETMLQASIISEGGWNRLSQQQSTRIYADLVLDRETSSIPLRTPGAGELGEPMAFEMSRGDKILDATFASVTQLPDIHYGCTLDCAKGYRMCARGLTDVLPMKAFTEADEFHRNGSVHESTLGTIDVQSPSDFNRTYLHFARLHGLSEILRGSDEMSMASHVGEWETLDEELKLVALWARIVNLAAPSRSEVLLHWLRSFTPVSGSSAEKKSESKECAGIQHDTEGGTSQPHTESDCPSGTERDLKQISAVDQLHAFLKFACDHGIIPLGFKFEQTINGTSHEQVDQVRVRAHILYEILRKQIQQQQYAMRQTKIVSPLLSLNTSLLGPLDRVVPQPNSNGRPYIPVLTIPYMYPAPGYRKAMTPAIKPCTNLRTTPPVDFLEELKSPSDELRTQAFDNAKPEIWDPGLNASSKPWERRASMAGAQEAIEDLYRSAIVSKTGEEITTELFHSSASPGALQALIQNWLQDPFQSVSYDL